MANQPGVHLEIWRGHNGALQVSISELDEKGTGHGYRLYGAKFCACCWRERLVDKVLDKRDADEIRSYIDKVPDVPPYGPWSPNFIEDGKALEGHD